MDGTATGEEECCPVCKSDRYLNPKMQLMVSPCYHKLCDGCVSRLFSGGSGPCPTCGTNLRRSNYSVPRFEDVIVEKECRVRRRLAGIFCKAQEDFETVRDYNDYLEEVEDIVFNLMHDVDVQQMDAKIESYRQANLEQIKRAQTRESTEADKIRAELAAEAERRRRLHEQALMDLQAEKMERAAQENSFLVALESSNESAIAIEGKFAAAVAANQLKSKLTSILPGLKGLRQTSGQSPVMEAIDPLETVPLIEVPLEEPNWSELSLSLYFENCQDPFEAHQSHYCTAGYNRDWLMRTCWQSALASGLPLKSS